MAGRRQSDATELEAAQPAGAGGFSLGDFLPYRLSVTTNRISRAFAERYSARFGLSIPEWRVLAVLGSFAPLSSNEICERTAMDKAKVSRAVALLTGKGLVDRAAHPEDQRLLRLSLSPRGRGTFEAVVPIAEELEAELTAELSAEERAVLDRCLERLGSAVGRLARPDER
ncbi:DNA-binding transcriptional regulator, MarR family [Tistlia consotensis]|uniref:DNA-binding transcriptional regulator, MarR family n=1 Tax=Tistlia consotensis USBA 355 TaxID=560819 RepID=A0A1Y6B575_9PROT|nr:MarR family transcriptional regulator [Tistlia consotensis]SME92854.1 DNA-binding transcriptional regulator, MarR family [Tistlia consotensis USBA 355]SNR28289.1 DNA-binding transcriptional regulator, MarR family [Tistlia consotensis]